MEPIKKTHTTPTSTNSSNLVGPFSGFGLGFQESESLKEPAITKEPKVKTRGTAEPRQNSPQIIEDPPTSHRAVFPVDESSYDVFSTIFFDPMGQEGHRKPIIWKDFMVAMRAVGFVQVYGSVWHFKPSKRMNLESSINFRASSSAGIYISDCAENRTVRFLPLFVF